MGWSCLSKQKRRRDSRTYIRTDVGVDFVEDNPNKYRSSRILEPKNEKVRYYESNNNYNHDQYPKCNVWCVGDVVLLKETNERVEILDRGLKGDVLFVRICYLYNTTQPGVVRELPLIQLMLVGSVISKKSLEDIQDDQRNNCDESSLASKSKYLNSSTIQPYYTKYSKPFGDSFRGLIYDCFCGKQHGDKGDTVDGRSTTPRMKLIDSPWPWIFQEKHDCCLIISKLLNDPEEFQRKRMYFENFYVATETGLKSKLECIPSEELSESSPSIADNYQLDHEILSSSASDTENFKGFTLTSGLLLDKSKEVELIHMEDTNNTIYYDVETSTYFTLPDEIETEEISSEGIERTERDDNDTYTIEDNLGEIIGSTDVEIRIQVNDHANPNSDDPSQAVTTEMSCIDNVMEKEGEVEQSNRLVFESKYEEDLSNCTLMVDQVYTKHYNISQSVYLDAEDNEDFSILVESNPRNSDSCFDENEEYMLTLPASASETIYLSLLEDQQAILNEKLVELPLDVLETGNENEILGDKVPELTELSSEPCNSKPVDVESDENQGTLLQTADEVDSHNGLASITSLEQSAGVIHDFEPSTNTNDSVLEKENA